LRDGAPDPAIAAGDEDDPGHGCALRVCRRRVCRGGLRHGCAAGGIGGGSSAVPRLSEIPWRVGMGENRRPPSVTDAQSAADEDYRRRIRQYTISMIIRVVCLLLAFVFSGPIRWVLLGGAVVFPWIAVVIANSRDERLVEYEVSRVTERAPRSLPTSAHGTAGTTAASGTNGASGDASGTSGTAADEDHDDVIIPGEEL